MGVKIQGKTIKMLHFANDIALLANTERELKKALNVTETVLNNYIIFRFRRKFGSWRQQTESTHF